METRKDIPWYEWLYQASTESRIRNSKGKILKQSIAKSWYMQLWFRDWKVFRVHRLLALTFLLNPDNKEMINHKDWNKLNNTLENLEWVTRSENAIHCYYTLWKTDCFPKCKRNTKWQSPKRKKVNQYTKDWNIIRSWDSMTEASEYLWMSHQAISDCCNLKHKTKMKSDKYYMNIVNHLTNNKTIIIKRRILII
jgi:hypothetical protein